MSQYMVRSNAERHSIDNSFTIITFCLLEPSAELNDMGPGMAPADLSFSAGLSNEIP